MLHLCISLSGPGAERRREQEEREDGEDCDWLCYHTVYIKHPKAERPWMDYSHRRAPHCVFMLLCCCVICMLWWPAQLFRAPPGLCRLMTQMKISLQTLNLISSIEKVNWTLRRQWLLFSLVWGVWTQSLNTVQFLAVFLFLQWGESSLFIGLYSLSPKALKRLFHCFANTPPGHVDLFWKK